GGLSWTQWRSEHLPVPQTTLSTYMRLAKGKDRLPSLATGVANLAATGDLSIRKAAALLADKKPRGKPKAKPSGDEDKARDFLRALDVDELVIILRSWFDSEYVERLRVALSTGSTSGTSARRV